MLSVATLTAALQALFTSTADELAAETGFARRKRLWTGPAFAQALTFGWLDRPDASLERLACHAGSSRQALGQRMTPEGVAFLAAVLGHAVELALEARPAALPLLGRFNGVYAEDCTTVALPDSRASDFLGCGGSSAADGLSAAKVYVRYELLTGAVAEVAFGPGRQPDVTAGQAHPALPAGALRLVEAQ
ncbi:MAG: hypothetical protein U0797_27515 [Gemmataceae bacterium]